MRTGSSTVVPISAPADDSKLIEFAGADAVGEGNEDGAAAGGPGAVLNQAGRGAGGRRSIGAQDGSRQSPRRRRSVERMRTMRLQQETKEKEREARPDRELACWRSLRLRCIAIVEHKLFDRIVLVCIVLNSAFLTATDPLDTDPDSARNILLDKTDLIFQIIFTIEMILKHVALWPFRGTPERPAYWSNPWNALDGVLVLIGCTAFMPFVSDSSNLTAVRTFRILRPLRTLNSMPGLKALVNSLLASLPQLVNVLILCLFIFFIYGIIAVQLFMGKLHQRCYLDGEEVPTSPLLLCNMDVMDPSEADSYRQCDTAGGEVCTVHHEGVNRGVTHFDNLLSAFLAIFQIITLEGWSEISWWVEQTMTSWSRVYFILLVISGAFFLLNLVVAVIISNLSIERARLRKARVADKAAKWGDMAAIGTGLEAMGKVGGTASMMASLVAKHHEEALKEEQKKELDEKKREELMRQSASSRRLRKYKEKRQPSRGGSRRGKSLSTHIEDSSASSMNSNRMQAIGEAPGIASGSMSGRGAPVSLPKRTLPPLKGVQRPESGTAVEGSGAAMPPAAFPSPKMPKGTPPRIATDALSAAGEADRKAEPAESDRSMVRAKPHLQVTVLSPTTEPSASVFQLSLPAQNILHGRLQVAGALVDEANGLVGSGSDDVLRSKLALVKKHLSDIRTEVSRYAEAADGSDGEDVDSLASSDDEDPLEWYRPDEFAPAWRHTCYNISVDRRFSNLIMMFIFANTVFLAIEHHDMPVWLVTTLEVANYVFTIVFTAEMVIKLAGLTFEGYASDSFNLFDASIVVISLLELLMAASSGEGQSLGVSALRTFRLMRVFKLARSWESLNLLIGTIARSLPRIGPFSVILLLIMFIFTLVGVQLFGGQLGSPPPRWNYDSMLWAFVTTFQVLTLENWNEVMYVCTEHVGAIAPVYFVVLVCIGAYIVLNLFLAILVDHFLVEGEKAAEEQKEKALRQIMREEREKAKKSEEASSSGFYEADKLPRVVDEALAKQLAEKPNVTPKDVKTQRALIARKMSRAAALVIHERREKEKLARQRSPVAKHVLKTFKSAEDSSRARLGLTSEHSDGAAPSPKDALARARKERRTQPRRSVSLSDYDPTPKRKRSSSGRSKEVEPSPAPSAASQTSRARAPWYSCHNKRFPLHPSYPYSPWCFSGEHPARLFVGNFVSHPLFEAFIIALILASCVLLAMDSAEAPTGTKELLDDINIAVTILFIIEMVLKLFAFGVYKHDGAYFTDNWNNLDAFIVVMSVVDMALQGAFKFIKAIRFLRGMRPLRLVRRLKGLRVVLNAVILALPHCVHVGLLSLLFFFIFGILGVNFFSGRLYRCTDPSRECLPRLAGEQCTPDIACEGTWVPPDADPGSEPVPREWVNPTYGGNATPFSFDHAGASMMTLFEVATLDLWTIVLYETADIRGVGWSPQRNANEGAVAFFIAFLVAGAFFIINLFVSVVVDNFRKIKRKLQVGGTSSAFMTAAQLQWVDMQRLVTRMRPAPLKMPPKSPIRQAAFRLVVSDTFEQVIMALIMLNVVIMAMTHRDMEDGWIDMMEVSNVIFMTIFALEMVLKLAGLGQEQYFASGWNRFDCALVVTNFMVVVLKAEFGVDLTILRMVRVFRMFRLVRTSPRLRTIFQTLHLSAPSMANVGALLSLVFFMFAVCGMSLFGEVEFGLYVHHQSNFRNFPNAMMILLRMSTGGNWNGIMHECSTVSAVAASLYFPTFVFAGQLMMLNLFVAVILENFEREIQAEADSGSVRTKDMDAFADAWKMLFQEEVERTGNYAADPAKLPVEMLVDLLDMLPPPLGMDRVLSSSKAYRLKFLTHVDAKHENGTIDYTDTLMSCVRAALNADPPSEEIEHDPLDTLEQRAEKEERLRNQRLMSKTRYVFAAKALQSWLVKAGMRRQARQVSSEALERKLSYGASDASGGGQNPQRSPPRQTVPSAAGGEPDGSQAGAHQVAPGGD